MSSALEIVITKLLAVSGVTAITASKVYPIEAPERVEAPYLIVSLVSEPEDQFLKGDGQYYESRVSIECLATTGAGANTLGETVKAALRGVVKATLSGCTDVDIWKEGTDVTDNSDARSLKRRTMDYYVRWK